MSKILFVMDSLEYGGAEKYVLSMINALLSANEITIITRNSHFSQILSQYKKVELIEADFVNMPKLVKILEKMVVKFDICFFVRWKAIVLGAMAKRKCTFRMVSMIMTVFEPGTRADGNNNIARDKELINILNNCSDKIVVTAECAKEAIIRYGVDEALINVINDATSDIKYLSASKKDGVLNIAYCGRLSYEKGPDILLDEFLGLVLNKYNNCSVRLHYIGQGNMEKHLKQKVQSVFCDKVVFHGFIDNPAQLLTNMDFVVIPSRHDAIPMSAIEAMCLEKVIIASDVGGLSECVINGENGFLYKDKIELREKMEYMISIGHEKITNMGKKSRELWEKKFDIAMFNDKVVKLCCEMVSET